MKLWIATPAYSGEVCKPFEDSLKSLLRVLPQEGITVIDWDYLIGCCYLPVARNKLVMKFLKSKADTLLFLDADVSWRTEDMVRFLKVNKDFVAGIYRMKSDAEDYPVHIYTDENGIPRTQGNLICAADVPTGCLKLNRRVFDKFVEHYGEDLAIDEPDSEMELVFSYWNFFDCEKIGRRWIGEDYNFCRKWREIGGEIFVYPDMTLGHHAGPRNFVGNYDYFLMRQPGGSEAGPVNPVDYPGNDIDGWTSLAELRFLFQEASKYDSVVEIGCYKGRSTHALAASLAKQIYCVDHWRTYTGISGIANDTQEDADQRYLEFTRHIDTNNGRIQVLRETSREASRRFADKSVDMVFIDGDHSEEGVREDIELWLPKAKKVICGHDYGFDNWPGVTKVVNELFGSRVKVVDMVWHIKLS